MSLSTKSITLANGAASAASISKYLHHESSSPFSNSRSLPSTSLMGTITPTASSNTNVNETSNNANTSVSYDPFDPLFPKWIAVVLLFVGVIGNSMCLFIFSQKNMRKNSTFIYLKFLAIIDLFVLSLGLGDIVILSYYNLNLRNKSLIMCRLMTFLIYSLSHLSSFILASVSIDRAIATNFITFSKSYCKPDTAYKIISVDIAISVFINFSHLIFIGKKAAVNADDDNASTTDYVNNPYNRTDEEFMFTCESTNNTKLNNIYHKLMENYFSWIDLACYAIIPFIIMGVCTFLIVRVLFRSNRRLNKSETSHGGGGKKEASSSSTPSSKNLLSKNKTANVGGANRANKAKHLTYTLIILNCLFFCLVGPLMIMLVVFSAEKLYTTKKIISNFVYMLAYANHSFNFVLYGFSSPPFRQELFRILGIKKSNGHANVNEQQTQHNSAKRAINATKSANDVA